MTTFALKGPECSEQRQWHLYTVQGDWKARPLGFFWADLTDCTDSANYATALVRGLLAFVLMNREDADPPAHQVLLDVFPKDMRHHVEHHLARIAGDALLGGAP